MKNVVIWLLLIVGPTFIADLTLSRLILSGTVALVCCHQWVKPNQPGKWLLVWLGWAGLSCVISPWPSLSIEGFFLRHEGLVTWITCFAIVLLTLYRRRIPTLEAVTHHIFFVIGISLLLGWTLWPRMGLSAIVTVVSVACYAIEPLSLLLSIPMTFAVGTRSGFAALIIGIITFSLFSARNKKWKYLAAAIVIGVVLASFSDIGSRFKRLDLARVSSGARSGWVLESYRKLLERPLTGWGLDTQSRLLKPATIEVYRQDNAITDRVHFMPLELAIQTGFIGLILCCCALGSAIYHCYYNPILDNRQCMSVICAWLAFSMFNPPGIPATAIALLAFFTIKPREVTP